ncbi:transcriptional regulator, AraC family [Acetobacteraceae bacterium AT-5844]|nr:transcriptional regulator, AraC family [Acetobacteraceae bacterium AT-5844]
MISSMPVTVSVRSYGAKSSVHLHDFAQLVLPLEGSLAIDIAGREAVLSRGLAAFVHQGTRHEQASGQSNRFLIMDISPDYLEPGIADRLASRPLVPLAPEANGLIDYMGLSLAKGAVPMERIRFWTPLLLHALVGDAPRPVFRLSKLLATLEAAPFADWTAGSMAAQAGLSVSRLHAVFREELDTTPRAWLAGLRLRHVQDWLAKTDLSIAEVAYRGGYADQSALTRAMRKATGLTPAAYRRRAQESWPKLREP